MNHIERYGSKHTDAIIIITKLRQIVSCARSIVPA
jgi:gamma-glutamyl phosphate reductase